MAKKTAKKPRSIGMYDLAVFLLLESYATDKPLTFYDAYIKSGHTVATASAKSHEIKNHPLYKKWIASKTANVFSQKANIEQILHKYANSDVKNGFYRLVV